MSRKTFVFRIEPTAQAVSALLDRLEAYATANQLSPRVAHRLAVVCEEGVANVIMHGAQGPGAATYVVVRIARAARQLQVMIEDDGRPFDPLAVASPDTGQGVEERGIGGLGIHFIRTMTQGLAYQRLDSRNRLTAVLDGME